MAESLKNSLTNQEKTPDLFKNEIIYLSKSLIIEKKVTYSIEKQGKGKNPSLDVP